MHYRRDPYRPMQTLFARGKELSTVPFAHSDSFAQSWNSRHSLGHVATKEDDANL